MNWQQILTATITLFVIIDILGSIPYLLVIFKREGQIQASKASIITLILMVLFLFTGQFVLDFLGISIHAFALAGSVIILASSIELVFGVSLFREDKKAKGVSSITPIAFPMLAGAGTLTAIITMKTQFQPVNILIGILINSIIVLLVLRSIKYINRKVSPAGFTIIRKSFGVIVMAISIQMLYTHILHITSA